MKLIFEYTDAHDMFFEKNDALTMALQIASNKLPTYFKATTIFLFNYMVDKDEDPSILDTLTSIKESITTVDIDTNKVDTPYLPRNGCQSFDFDYEIKKVIPDFFDNSSSRNIRLKKLLIHECAKRLDKNSDKLEQLPRLNAAFIKAIAKNIMDNFPDWALDNCKTLEKMLIPSNELKYSYFKLLYALRNKPYTELARNTESLLNNINAKDRLFIKNGVSEFDHIGLLHPSGINFIKNNVASQSTLSILDKLINLEKQSINKFGIYIIFKNKNYTPHKIMKRMLQGKFSFFEITLPPTPLITPFKEYETEDEIEYTTTELDESRLRYFKNNIFKEKLKIDDKWISTFSTLLSNYIYAKDVAAIKKDEFKKFFISFAEKQEELYKHMRSPIIGSIRSDIFNRIAGLTLYDIKNECQEKGTTYGNAKIIDIFYERFRNDFIEAKNHPDNSSLDKRHLIRHLKHAEQCVEQCEVLSLTGRQ